MTLKAPGNYIIQNLSDWELIIAYGACNNIIELNTEDAIDEFKNLRDTYHGGDDHETMKSLENVKLMYMQEYQKRHGN
jgi:hypothetical protein